MLPPVQRRHLGPLTTVSSARDALLTLLTLPASHRATSPWLLALVMAMTARLVPYLVAFSGIADPYAVLVFAPFDLALLWGPLLWGYVTALTTQSDTRENVRPLRVHLVPGVVHVAYQCAALVLPLQWKLWWYVRVHTRFVLPAVAALTLISLSVYGYASWTAYASWRARSSANVPVDADTPTWLVRATLGWVALTAIVGAALLLVHTFVVPLIFLANLPAALGFATLTYVVIVAAVRLARLVSPAVALAIEDAVADAVADTAETVSAVVEQVRDAQAERYRAQAEAWRQRVVDRAWHRDSQLTLDALAAALHTSPRTLSRTLNAGLGCSFHTLINQLRVEDAARLLAQPDAPSVLEIAFAVGFASKASFNRAFQRHLGRPPSALRVGETSQDSPNEGMAPSETTA